MLWFFEMCLVKHKYLIAQYSPNRSKLKQLISVLCTICTFILFFLFGFYRLSADYISQFLFARIVCVNMRWASEITHACPLIANNCSQVEQTLYCSLFCCVLRCVCVPIHVCVLSNSAFLHVEPAIEGEFLAAIATLNFKRDNRVCICVRFVDIYLGHFCRRSSLFLWLLVYLLIHNNVQTSEQSPINKMLANIFERTMKRQHMN